MSKLQDRYFAKVRMKVGTGYREPGEEVPEAATWKEPARRHMINMGKLEVRHLVVDEKPAKKAGASEKAPSSKKGTRGKSKPDSRS